MRMILRIVLILFFFGLLFFVRAFELELFYDPLNSYFQNEYLFHQKEQSFLNIEILSF